MSIRKGTVIISGGTTSPSWGSIEGILSDQVDLNNILLSKANLDSPVLTGIPTAPTANEGTSTKQIATTEFVQTAVQSASSLPDQTGKNGKFLKTNGTTASWESVPNELPSQSGQSGKILSTNGTTASWISYNPTPETDNTSITLNSQNKLQASGVIDKNTGNAKYDWVGTYSQWEAGRDNNTIPDDWVCFITDDYDETIISHNIGDIFYSLRTDNVMNGAVVCDGSTYNIADYSQGEVSVQSLLENGKLPSVPMTTFNSTVSTKGSCRCFGYDGGSTFKVPKLNDVFIEAGNASSNSEFIDAGLPNITGSFTPNTHTGQDALQTMELGDATASGALSYTYKSNILGTSDYSQNTNQLDTLSFNASNSNSIYGNSDTVQPNAVKYRAFVQLASATTETALQTVSSIVNDVDVLSEKVNSSLRYDKITNCITEIPQDIKVELNNGTLTLKAGSKVYVPNGFEQDGTTLHFDEITVINDISSSTTFISDGQAKLYLSVQGSSQAIVISDTDISGTTPPTEKIFYNTSQNTIKYYQNGSPNSGLESFPLVCISYTQSGYSSIDQVFNGFGYIGSSIFALPGLKGLMPNGRNEDGTLKNIEYTVSNVIVTTSQSTINGYRFSAVEAPGVVQPYEFLTNNGFNEYFESDNKPTLARYKWFDLANNLQYWHNENDENHPEYHGLYPIKNFIIANYYVKDGKITEFYPRKTFRALDYNDKSTISGWSMPSEKYIDLTLGENGTSYIAPANGYFTLNKITGGSNKSIFMYGPWIGATSSTSSSTEHLICSIPVKRGDSVAIYYNVTGETRYFRFVYLEGEI